MLSIRISLHRVRDLVAIRKKLVLARAIAKYALRTRPASHVSFNQRTEHEAFSSSFRTIVRTNNCLSCGDEFLERADR